MNLQEKLENKQARLQARLSRNILKKRALDIEINREFEELKKIETSIEITSKQQTSTQ